MPSTEDSRPRYRPYRSLVDSIQRDLESRDRHELTLLGGRKMGKTTIAAAVESALGQRTLAPIEIVQGRPAEVGVLRLNKPETAAAKTLVIDDADILLTSPDGRSALRTILLSRSWQDNNRSCIILTARNIVRLRKAAQDDDICSQLIEKSTAKNLEPWHGDWRAVLREAVREVVSDGHDVWFGAIVDETGGHPALVGQALENLESTARFFTLGTGDEALARAREYVKSRLASYVEYMVERTLRDYGADFQRDLEQLTAAVTNPSSAEVPSSAEEVGLAYQTPHFERRFISASVVKALERALASQSKDARPDGRLDRLVFRPDPHDPQHRGVALRLRGRTAAQEIHLSGSLWRLAISLQEAGGTVVSIERLERQAAVHSRAALSSSLQRLRVALNGLGFGLALENVRNRGYRLRPGTSADTSGDPPTG